MIWIANLICLVNLVQASMPSLGEIVSRTRWCMGENAHCPVNLFKNVDLCCKPLVCTVVPKTCRPNLINKYFNISDYKDRRCMFPKIPMFNELPIESASPVTLNATPSLVKLTMTTETNEYSSTTKYYDDSNVTELGILSDKEYNTTSNTERNHRDISNETEFESYEENTERIPSKESFHGSLLDSMSYFIDSNNEIRQLVKRYISNDSSVQNSLSISSISLEGTNFTSEREGSYLKPLTDESAQNNISLEYSDSGSVSESGEDYDNINNKKQNNTSGSLRSESNKKVSLLVTTEPEEDWHSSDMKLDSRPKLFKVVTANPLRWFETGAQVVRLNLSSEISE